MKLLVGLGNPGSQYAHNRHNIGFHTVDAIQSRHGFSLWRARFQGQIASGSIDGTKVALLKPETYMNESGRSVGEAARYFKIPLEDIYVFYDELDLAPGKIRIKTGGGSGGHNGIKSIDAHIGKDYQRVRIGIGHPGHKHLVSRYVLSDFAKADADWLEPLLQDISNALPKLLFDGPSQFMNTMAMANQSLAQSTKKTVTRTDEPGKQPARTENVKENNKNKGPMAAALSALLGKPKKD